MNTEVSTPIKIFAALGLLIAVGFGAMTMMGGGSSSSSATLPRPHSVLKPAAAATPTSSPAPAATKHAPAASKHAPAASKHAPAHAAPAAKHATPATHAAPATHASAPSAAHAKAKTKAHRTPLPAVAANGLPFALNMLLHIHRVVVVAVYDPEIPTDKLFVAEARAGAKDANAGFLAVSVLDERVAAPLTAVAGNGALLPSPGLLVYKQPALLMNTISGFIDRQAVADAVANALLADAPAQPAATTAATATTPAVSPPASTPATTTP